MSQCKEGQRVTMISHPYKKKRKEKGFAFFSASAPLLAFSP